MKIVENYSLLNYNTFGIDVKARRFIEYSDLDELAQILSNSELFKEQVFHIGGGSNLLFTKDFDGTILHSAVKYIDVENETDEYVDVKVGSGVVWDDFVVYCIERDWRGTENLSVIPGEIGASAVQNIGAYGVEVKDLIQKVCFVDLVDGKEHVFENADCKYSYRNSIFKQELKNKTIVTSVSFRLYKHIPFNLNYGALKDETLKSGEVNAANVRKAVITIRENKLPDPAVIGNAGSFFVNPVIRGKQFQRLSKIYPDMPHYLQANDLVKVPAGWLIEQCGWKGKQIGNVAVYDKQALVLVNKGGATGEEVLHFSEAIRQSVKERFDIHIYPEVNIL